VILADLLLVNASEIITCVPKQNDSIGRIKNASIAIKDEHIIAVGKVDDIDTSRVKIIDCSGKILAPGFVDSHTHLIFGGSRVREYAAKMTMTREQIAALNTPTGILATVNMTRAASVEELTLSAEERLKRMWRYGTTTVESKSGYGLTASDEIKLLEVNQKLRASQSVDIISTFLGAHDIPKDVSRERYIESIIKEMIPQVAERKLAEFCDVFCDEGYYTAAESKMILEAGMKAGLKPKIHSEQYSAIGGAMMCAGLGAVSADHLNYADRTMMRTLAKANVIGVVTPVLDFAVKHPKPFEARAMIEEGMTLALATDFCPACWCESMQVVMQFACRNYKMSPEEALIASTVNGAKALGLNDRGALAVGMLADIQVWDVPTFEDVIYRIGNNAVRRVIKRGRIGVTKEKT